MKVDDNVKEVETEMVAGIVGITCSSSGIEGESGVVALDTMKPQSGWCIYAKTSGEHPSLAGLRERARERILP